jgi:zinc/manganese transport system permease protein
MNEIQLFFPAIVMCIMLSIVHAYLGLHVIEREVIFIDLSLAQVAALGSSFALLIGISHENAFLTYLFSFLMTVLAAFYLSYVRRIEKRFSLEALIGILYGFASAITLLLLDKEPHGLEVVKGSLVGNILFVGWEDVKMASLIYSPLCILVIFFHRQIEKSSHLQTHWRWDFLFYSIFGAVVASSTKYSGVLMVFSLLVTPNLIAKGIFQSMANRLVFCIFFNLIITALSMVASYFYDFPVGAVNVALATGVALIFCLGWSILNTNIIHTKI